MLKKVAVGLMLAAVPLLGLAVDKNGGGEVQAKAFADLYAGLCLKHLNDLTQLRARLASQPRLQPKAAAFFLSGQPGDAWPVNDPRGEFVVALPADGRMCVVYARRADTTSAQRQFLELVEKAPYPFVVNKLRDVDEASPNGATHTLSYGWKTGASAPRSLLFTLTVAPSDKAQLQVMGSAAVLGH